MRVVAMLAALVAVLTGCSSQGDQAALDQAGALAAAQAYVDAIAARDPDRANAMTDPDALSRLADGRAVDVRAALKQAVTPISDPWVSIAGGTFDAQRATGGFARYVVNVSWKLGELTGGDAITVELPAGGDASRVDDWVVTDALLDRAYVRTDAGIESARIGDLVLSVGRDRGQRIDGYPGAYEVTGAETAADVEPLRIVLGAPDLPRWNAPYPRLGRTG